MAEIVTFDPLNKNNSTLSNNNLTASTTSTVGGVRSTLGREEGKWYCEFTSPSTGQFTIGIISSALDLNTNTSSLTFNSNLRAYSPNVSTIYPEYTSYGTYPRANDVYSILLDLDVGTLEFMVNGISQGVSHTNLKSMQYPIYIYAGNLEGFGAHPVTANFGDTSFLYPIPVGYNPYGGIIQKKILIRHNDNYYYYDETQWVSIGFSPTVEEIINLGMDSVNAQEINNFESIYGESWEAIYWTDGDSAINAVLEAIPPPQILTAKNSIQLTGVESATFKWIATGGSRVSLSVDNGVTYHAYKNGLWVDVTNDMSNAMTASEYTNLTWEQYKILSGDSNFLKHQYYIPDNSTVDDILIIAELSGTNKLADSNSYTLSYDQSTKTVRYQISKSGSYFANALDIN